jgi:amino acid adenylation domain-containing protein/non-ribosomal peptide synthase protein (TIGR01720 family)
MIEKSPQVDDLELLDLLLADEKVERLCKSEFRRDGAAAPQLSRAQHRIWFLQQMAPNSPVYNIFCAVRLSGPLDLNALQSSLNEIVRRHESLRSYFPTVDGRPSVSVRREWALDFPIDDLSGNDWRVRHEHVRRLCIEEARRPFDLSAGPLLRLGMLRLGEFDNVVLLSIHHIIADGWSMAVMVNELSQLYGAFVRGRGSPLPELTLQYPDFAIWQEHWLKEDVAAGQRRWWEENLAGLTPLELPTDRPRPAEPSYRGAVYAFRLPGRLAFAIKDLGRQKNATLFMTLLAAFSVLLHRYTGQEDIVVGSPVANRNHRELEPLIGLFVNTLVMRCDLSGGPSFLAVLERVRDFTLNALAHQDVPFEELVNRLAPERDTSKNPLFQVMFSLENAPSGALRLPELTLTPIELETGLAKFDLLLNISETAEGLLAAAFEYATDLFDDQTVALMAGHFTTLLEAIATNPEAEVATLPLLSAAERRQLADWNDSATPYPREEGLATLFERQALRTPDAIAVEFGPERISYGELNAAANRLARRLRECGVGSGTPVAVHAHRSVDLVTGLLATVKAGGFYVPLDPAYPTQRLELMLDDCRAPVLLTQRNLPGLLPVAKLTPVYLDEDPDGYADSNPDWPAAGGGDLAYVIYTSGSTGIPKGVTVPHRAVCRLVLNSNYVALLPDDVVAQASNASFDAATFEIWGALLNGARLVGVDHDLALSPPKFAAFLRERRITTLFLTTALFNQIARETPGAFRSLRHLLFGGEKVDPQRVRHVLQHGPPERLLHVYGPTENTTFSTWKEVRDVSLDATTVPIGKAISNTHLYILDARLQPVPVGVFGELHLAGDGLAQGYFGRPESTAESFIPNPFDGGSTKLYRTGDIVRRLRNGDVEFIGRRDSQVKIRGFRIELGEIETALLNHPAIREAVVLAREDRPGERELAAYVVAKPGDDVEPRALRQYLADQLPSYMVPSIPKYVALASLPLNENGKVDRKALPAPAGTSDLPHTYDPPTNAQEQCLARVWRDVLCCPEVGTHDNYFELGGDSIAAIQVVSRLRRFGWQLGAADLFRYPTVAQLAPHLREYIPGANALQDSGDVGDVPLTPVQCWFFEHYQGDRNHFNQAVLLKPTEALNEGHLRSALGELLRRHDALRLRFAYDGASVRQTCGQAGESPVLEVVDLCQASEPVAAMELYANAIQRGLDLQRGPILKTGLFRLADGDRLLLVIHHLVVDAVSWRILLEELELGYRQVAANHALELGAETCSFRRWAEEIQILAASQDLRAEEEYWSQIENAELPRLPTDNAGSALRHHNSETLHAALSREETTGLLTQVHRVFQTEIMDVLLTALGRALKQWSGRKAVKITLEGHGREPHNEALDLSLTVGWFTSIYPFVLAVSGEDIGQHILQVKTALREVPRKGLGYGILRYIGNRREPRASGSVPQLSFNYLGQFEDATPGGLFKFSNEPSGKAVGPALSRVHELDITGLVASGHLILSLEFDPNTLARETAAALLDALGQQLREVVRYCQDRPEQGDAPSSSAETRWNHLPITGDVEDAYPLSPLQEGLLFHSLLDPASEAYFVQSRFQFAGILDSDAFEKAWFELCRRHAILRSAFIHQDLPRPMQVVLKDRKPEVSFVDLRHLEEGERGERVEVFCLNDRRRGFDLQRGALLRVAVFREGENDYHIVWSYHHILIDGWCLAILQRDFLEIYTALLSRRRPRLPPVAPYRNYIRWLSAQDLDAARQFWGNYLEGYEQLATLPKFANPDDTQPRSLTEETLVLDADESSRLVGLASHAGVTLNAVMLSLWGLLLSRYNDTDDVVFGVIVSGRPSELAGIEGMVGLFISAVPVRVVLTPDMPFSTLVRTVQDDALASQPHQHLSLAEIQLESALGRNLFDHMVIFENYPLRTSEGAAASQPLAFTPTAGYAPTHYDLDVTVVPGERIIIKFTFDLRLYEPDQLRRTAEHLRTAVASILRNPTQPLREIMILPPSERDHLLGEFNATKAECPRDHSFVNLFEAQVEMAPDAVALTLERRQLTYGELNNRANQLAHRLIELGVGRDVLVAICLDRSFELVVSVLAVLKAGGAYVPLDLTYPQERLSFMLEDSAARLLLTDRQFLERLTGDQLRVICLEPNPELLSEGQTDNPDRTIAGDDLAYVIYTSGSSGRPKGCQIEHRNLMHYLTWASRYFYPDGRGGSFGLFTSLSFDLTVTSLFLPLIRGRTLRIFPSEALLDSTLRSYFHPTSTLDSIKLTPAHLSLLPSLGLPQSKVEVAIVGGEQLLVEQVRSLWRINPRMRIFNEYGPTEATVGCVVKEIFSGEDRIVIGQPIDNTRVYVLDKHLQPLPVSMPGELYIGGKGLARGYLNRPELTAERFISDPFSTEGGARLYRSGDLARWLPSGNLEFLGRCDQQVKVRGVRIELGEIESILAAQPDVEQAIVDVRDDSAGEKRLVAWYVRSNGDGLPPTGLRECLRGKLPDYMVPDFFVRLDRLPLSLNGKVDRKTLPDPRTAAERPTASLSPRTATEAALAAIWRQVLQVDGIGVLDDFFELGGHSLKAMQITAKIHAAFGVQIPLREFFDRRTISELGGIIDAGDKSAWSHISLAPRQDHYELSHAQRRLWILHQMERATAYNMPGAYIIDADIDADTLSRAFQTLIRRHEALRTAFPLIDGEPRQLVLENVLFAVAEFDLCDDPQAERRAREIADRDANQLFDLAAPPLLRAALVRLPGRRSLFTLTMHHIIGDGWSGNLIYRELLTLYEAYRRGRPDPLKPLRIQYKDFAVWQNANGFAQHEDYWLAQLNGMPERARLPYDLTLQTARASSGAEESADLDPMIVAGLRSLAARRGTTVSTVVLALFDLLLFHWTRQEDFCVGLSVANRTHPDTEDLIGIFVNILPIRCRANAEMEFGELLGQVIGRMHGALEHQEYPFDRMIQRINPLRGSDLQPLVNVVYAFQNFADVRVELETADPGFEEIRYGGAPPTWTAFDVSFATSQFDLTLLAVDAGNGMRLTFRYDGNLFLAPTIRKQLRLLADFAGMVVRPSDL